MEQKDIFNRLKDMISDKIGIIIVDTISMLYRVELGGNKLYEINQELGKQLSYLLEIARKREIPCLITAQVYNDFDVPGNMKIVGGEIIKYSSKVLIEITIDERSNRTMILRKHPSLPESKIEFKITQNGLEKIKKNFILG
jgi:DNA repair protein RadB